MSHLDMKLLESYAAGTLRHEDNELLEQHLYNCDDCLQHYLLAVDQQPTQQAELLAAELAAKQLSAAEFTDRVMQAIHAAAADTAVEAVQPAQAMRPAERQWHAAAQAVRPGEARTVQPAAVEAARSGATRTIQPAAAQPQAAQPAPTPTVRPATAPSRLAALFRRSIVQYTIAASITIVLMTTGVFHNVEKLAMPQSAKGQRHTMQDPAGQSFSQQLMEKTTNMLNTIHSNRTGGTPHE